MAFAAARIVPNRATALRASSSRLLGTWSFLVRIGPPPVCQLRDELGGYGPLCINKHHANVSIFHDSNVKLFVLFESDSGIMLTFTLTPRRNQMQARPKC